MITSNERALLDKLLAAVAAAEETGRVVILDPIAKTVVLAPRAPAS